MAKRFEELEIVFKAKFPNAGKTIELSMGETASEPKPEPQAHPKIDLREEESTIRSIVWEEEEDVISEEERGSSTILNIMFYAILALMVGCAVWFTTGVRGIQFYEVLTDSMQSVYPKGSLVVATQAVADELAVFDDIAFLNKDGEFIVLQISEVIENETNSGGRAFVTKGIDDSESSQELVEASAVIGKVIIGIPLIGMVSTWISNNPAIVLAIAIMLAMMVFGIRFLWEKKIKLSLVVVILVGLLCITNETEVFAQWQEESSEGTEESAEEHSEEESMLRQATEPTPEETLALTLEETLEPTPNLTALVTISPLLTQELDVVREETESHYSGKDAHSLGRVTYVDVGRSFMVLILGMISAKIVGSILEGLKHKVGEKSQDSEN